MLARLRAHAADAINQLRDGRRWCRRQLDELFDRKTFAAVLVVGPATDALLRAAYGRPWAPSLLLTAAGLVVAVYWRRLAQAADDVGEAVEDAVDPD